MIDRYSQFHIHTKYSSTEENQHDFSTQKVDCIDKVGYHFNGLNVFKQNCMHVCVGCVELIELALEPKCTTQKTELSKESTTNSHLLKTQHEQHQT